jgi:cytoskeletal protein CcmA (bactofilin family)/DNA-directed RNA polymerase subunit RPC12/RpoP
MPALQQNKAPVLCPKCGHTQHEPRTVYSTVCKRCGQHFRVEEVPKPAAGKVQLPRVEFEVVTCFQCGTALEVSVNAQSTMCKRCSCHIDLRDYQIVNTISRNFKTKGLMVIEERGFLLNTDSIVSRAVLRGKLQGRLRAEQSLTIHPTAEIKGSFHTAHLVLPEPTRLRWKEDIVVVTAEIAGELVANLKATGTVTLKGTARLFGNVQAGGLIVEDGAVLVGTHKIGARFSAAAATKPEERRNPAPPSPPPAPLSKKPLPSNQASRP